MTLPLKTFDQIWEEGESLFQGESTEDLESVLKSLEMKINLFRILSSKKEIPEEDLKSMKFKIIGEILLTMTNLSLIENINVHHALKESIQIRSIEQLASQNNLKL